MPAGIFPKLDTLIVRVRDLDASREWYEEKLGLAPQFIDPHGEIVVLDCGGTTSLTLWRLGPGEVLHEEGSKGSFPIFFSDDADAHHALLESRGIECGPIVAQEGARFFPFYDLDGNRLEVCQY